MESGSNEGKKFLEEILNKYDFITKIFITDPEGNLISSMEKENPEADQEAETKLRLCFSNIYNNDREKILKGEKTNNKSITSFFENIALYQTKLGSSINAHFVCDINIYNHSIIKDVAAELKKKMEKAENDIETIKKESDN